MQKRKKTVYITRDTDEYFAEVWDAKIGIRKRQGCVQFVSGSRLSKDGIYLYNKHSVYGRIEADLNEAECREQYGSFPLDSAAYLVEDKGSYWLWTRIDHNLHLLDFAGNIITE